MSKEYKSIKFRLTAIFPNHQLTQKQNYRVNLCLKRMNAFVKKLNRVRFDAYNLANYYIIRLLETGSLNLPFIDQDFFKDMIYFVTYKDLNNTNTLPQTKQIDKYPFIYQIVTEYHAILKKQNYKFESSYQLPVTMTSLSCEMYNRTKTHLIKNCSDDEESDDEESDDEVLENKETDYDETDESNRSLNSETTTSSNIKSRKDTSIEFKEQKEDPKISQTAAILRKYYHILKYFEKEHNPNQTQEEFKNLSKGYNKRYKEYRKHVKNCQLFNIFPNSYQISNIRISNKMVPEVENYLLSNYEFYNRENINTSGQMDDIDNTAKSLMNIFKIKAEYLRHIKCFDIQAVYTDGYSASVLFKRGSPIPNAQDKYTFDQKDENQTEIEVSTNKKIIDPSEEKLMGIDPGDRFIITGVSNQVLL